MAARRDDLDQDHGAATLNVNQAWYDWYVAATPDSGNQVYLGAIDTLARRPCGLDMDMDQHHHAGRQQHPSGPALPAFAPGNSKIIYAGNDGGIFRSANRGSELDGAQQGPRDHRDRIHGQ